LRRKRRHHGDRKEIVGRSRVYEPRSFPQFFFFFRDKKTIFARCKRKYCIMDQEQGRLCPRTSLLLWFLVRADCCCRAKSNYGLFYFAKLSYTARNVRFRAGKIRKMCITSLLFPVWCALVHNYWLLVSWNGGFYIAKFIHTNIYYWWS
jgi:hypothetical protein